MNRRTGRYSLSAGLAAGLLGTALLGAGSPAFAVPVEANADAAQQCTVESAELRWGVKERFRNYISGSIANGEWVTADGAGYETPTFIWPTGTGVLSNDLSAGNVDFTGKVHFTGHGGAMQLDLQDPRIVFTGPKTAQLVMEMGSVDTEGTQLALQPVVAAEVDLAGASITDGTSYSIENAPVTLTAEGAEAFNGEYGDYATGESIDALALSIAVSGCAIAADTGSAAPPEEDTGSEQGPGSQEDPSDTPEVPWVLIAIGGIAIVAIGVTTALLLSGRKREHDASGDREEQPGQLD